MRIVSIGIALFFSVSAASAIENPVENRAKCLIHPAAKSDREWRMARGLRIFAESVGIAAAPNSILVRLVPDRENNNSVQEFRESDLAGQWSVGPNGALVYNDSKTDRCVLRYNVFVSARVDGRKVGGQLLSPVEMQGTYVETLTPAQRIRVQRRGRRRA